MSQQQFHTTCTLIPGNNGDLQVAVSGGRVIVDIQASDFDVAGQLQHTHSMLSLSYASALALRDLIDEIAEPADARQTAFEAIWSNGTHTVPIVRPRRRRQRAVA